MRASARPRFALELLQTLNIGGIKLAKVLCPNVDSLLAVLMHLRKLGDGTTVGLPKNHH